MITVQTIQRDTTIRKEEFSLFRQNSYCPFYKKLSFVTFLPLSYERRTLNRRPRLDYYLCVA